LCRSRVNRGFECNGLPIRRPVRVQVDFDLSFLKSSLSLMAEGVQSGPERSRARSLRRQRTLDGEDRSVTIPPGRKGTVASDSSSFLFFLFLFLRAQTNPVATLPSALSMSDFVSLGASWVFSFQPVLSPDYRPLFPSRDGSWARPLTQSPELGAGARCFRFNELELCGCRQQSRSAVAQRFVSLSGHPQAMQQHGSDSGLSRHSGCVGCSRAAAPRRTSSVLAPC
jgi:hypothetical protein